LIIIFWYTRSYNGGILLWGVHEVVCVCRLFLIWTVCSILRQVLSSNWLWNLDCTTHLTYL